MNAKCCLQINSKISEFFSCNAGVHEGENVSPLLFAIYLNDLTPAMRNVHVCKRLTHLYYTLAGTLGQDDPSNIFETLCLLLYADYTSIRI